MCYSQPANFSLHPTVRFLVTMSFFTESMKLFLFCKEVRYIDVWIPPRSDNMRYLSLFVSLTSPSVIVSGSSLWLEVASFHPFMSR